jgi:hypothetical protein
VPLLAFTLLTVELLGRLFAKDEYRLWIECHEDEQARSPLCLG